MRVSGDFSTSLLKGNHKGLPSSAKVFAARKLLPRKQTVISRRGNPLWLPLLGLEMSSVDTAKNFLLDEMIEQSTIKDCSLHCFHYQQMLEMLFKHLLQTKSQYGSYSHRHNKLLEELIAYTPFRTDKYKYRMPLQVITAEEYRYNFLIVQNLRLPINDYGLL